MSIEKQNKPHSDVAIAKIVVGVPHNGLEQLEELMENGQIIHRRDSNSEGRDDGLRKVCETLALIHQARMIRTRIIFKESRSSTRAFLPL